MPQTFSKSFRRKDLVAVLTPVSQTPACEIPPYPSHGTSPQATQDAPIGNATSAVDHKLCQQH